MYECASDSFLMYFFIGLLILIVYQLGKDRKDDE